MKEKKFKILFGILIIILIIVITVIKFCFDNKVDLDFNEVIINSDGSIPNYNYENFNIENSTLVIDKENNGSLITLTIKNDSDEEKYLDSVLIVIKDKQKKIISNLLVPLDNTLKPHQEYKTSTGTNIVIEDAYIVEYQFYEYLE